MPHDVYWQLCLLIGMSLDLVGAILVLSAVVDFSSRRFHKQLRREVEYIDSALIDAKQKAELGFWFIVAGFLLAFAKEARDLSLAVASKP